MRPSLRIPSSVLIIDPDPAIRAELDDYLGRHGISVRLASSAESAEDVLAGERVDLVFMDIMLPDADGLDLCRALASRKLPVIVASAIAEEADRVIGLEFGADDYLIKPFGLREALARIRAVLRRRTAVSAPAAPADGGFLLDSHRLVISVATGQSARLTGKEHALLRRFMSHSRETMTRDRLAGATTRDPQALRAIDVQVSRLRHKIRRALGADLIETVRNFGYMLVADIRLAEESILHAHPADMRHGYDIPRDVERTPSSL